MSILVISHLTLRIAGRTLLEEANLTLEPGKKVGLIGKNGTGKSTLLRTITGEMSHEGGEIQIAKRARIAYIRQEQSNPQLSLLETVLQSDTERTTLLQQAQHPANAHDLAEIHERLRVIEAASAPARASSILAGLGFSAEGQNRPLADFSGGWRMRVALACALFLNPDLLLLDEPTNHLDLEATLWLQNWLQRFHGAALIVSHDREILDNTVSAIAHLDHKKLSLTPGGYTEFVRIRQERQLQHNRTAERIAQKRAHMESFIQRFRAKATKARQAQARVKALEKMPTLDAIVEDNPVHFSFPEITALPPPLIRADSVSLGYDGHPLLSNLSFRIDQEDRIALLGANGNGKSTLAKFLSGKLAPLQGELLHSPKLRVGYFAQHQDEELNERQNAVEHLLQANKNLTPTQARSHLAHFGLEAQKAETKIASLSGGEKARLLLALCTLHAPHLLVLDEPTNHLDLDAREALIHALAAYNGSVILISHDPHLITTVSDQLWLVKDGHVHPFEGDMEDYRQWLLEPAQPTSSASPPANSTNKKDERRERAEHRAAQAPLRKKIQQAETQLAKLAQEQAEIEHQLAQPDFYTEANKHTLVTLNSRLAQIKDEIQTKEEEWLLFQEEIEG
ncbi:ABC-F family ATP-binding cassette domain-containing protein [Entomobacter blattae]|uniref:Putative ABC transporter ATP-binding protein YheS n=1 Tax=Entomobacter blattae TaxID=2762277 RepID=A0A7H1NRZ6_9PROT|nr:ABC-F family ATP-binding cassette domain-containing protein [Entomobacter blattae]QNT78556.1 putative ABC transporter ATP-binding protein YheS [Entomobacter blattae]